MSEPQHRSPASSGELPSDELILAALQRAIRHRADAASAAPIWAILEQLDIPRRGSAARHVKAALRSLREQGRVTRTHPHGVEAWELTDLACRELLRAKRAGSLPALPESPQHREWRNATVAAAQELPRFERSLDRDLRDALRLTEAPASVTSDTWFALAEVLRKDCRRVGSATYCLREWPEPDEQLADHDDRVDGGDEDLDPEERRRRHVLRQGRRNIRLWRERG